jgi:hypothetical protein
MHDSFPRRRKKSNLCELLEIGLLQKKGFYSYERESD